MAKPNSPKGFPCVICGKPRSKTGKSRKYKICHDCYVAIRYEVTPNKGVFYPECILCGKEINKVQTFPTCIFCRTKFYRIKRTIKQIDDLIAIQDYSHLGVKVMDLKKYGFDVVITKTHDPLKVEVLK